MSGNKILIVSGCKFPEGDAGSVRIHSLVKLFELCGKQSIVLGKGKFAGKDGSFYDGIHYFSFRGEKKGILQKIIDRITFANRINYFLKVHESEFSHILIVDVPFKAIDVVVKYAKNNGIVLMHDSLEWYSSCEFKLGILNPMYIHRDRLNKYKINSDFKVIAISKYLENYFRNKGCETIRIPAILGPAYDRKPAEIKSKIIITYAGLPEKKDKLIEILEAFSNLESVEKDKLELRIIGISLMDLKKLYRLSCSDVQKIQDGTIFYGRVSRSEVLKKLEETHFTIFYRDASERYAKAGFPTKVAESTSKGIPVITNITSDLADYLVDGENSIIIGDDPETIKSAFIKVSHVTNSQYRVMSKNAKTTFDSSFCYLRYHSQIDQFWGEL